jgi:site-specific recombinase XerC
MRGAPACRRSPLSSRYTSPTWIEAGTREFAAPSVRQRFAAIRHLFDWLVIGQVVPVNPAASVRGHGTS